MPKKTTHQDAVKPLEQFRAPWETEGGGEAEIVKPTLKKFIHALIVDKARAQDARDELTETLATVEKERDDAKADAEKASPDEANRKIKRLEDKVADLTAERDKLVSDKEQADLRAEVLGDLDPKYAKYVKGETQEELEASLEEVKKDFNLESSNEEEEEEDEDRKVRTTPRTKTRLRNSADPSGGKGGDEIDFDKVADGIVGAGSIFG